MRLVDAFRSSVERGAMQKPAKLPHWRVVYEFADGEQWVGCRWDSHALAAEVADYLGECTPRFILKVTPK